MRSAHRLAVAAITTFGFLAASASPAIAGVIVSDDAARAIAAGDAVLTTTAAVLLGD